MGILDMLRGQCIDVIEWTDSGKDTMVHKYDMNGKEIMMGAQLTVRESQVAVFVNEGQLADVYQPGRYELQTSNMPIMTKLKAWKFGFNSPFKADVYFVNTIFNNLLLYTVKARAGNDTLQLYAEGVS